MADENKRAHLAMIQGIINRLSANSFHLKGWSVVLVSGLFALAANDTEPRFVYLAYFPVIAFWALDGYFLWQERIFRGLYKEVRLREEVDIDFSMDTKSAQEESGSWWDAFASLTLRLFHGSVLFTVLVVMLVLIASK